MYFVVTRKRGAAWNNALPMAEQPGWAEHAAFMNGLADAGFVILGGPIRGTGKVLLIVAAESDQVVRARLAQDPWSPMRLLTVTSVEPWEILLGEPSSR